MSPALEGVFLTTAPPGKPFTQVLSHPASLAAYFLKHEKSSSALFLHRGSRETMGTLAPWALLGREEIQVWLACLEHRDPQDSRSDAC